MAIFASSNKSCNTMPRTKKNVRIADSVRIRFKDLASGGKSIYLDIYHDGKRKYEFLGLRLIPQKTPFDKQQNDAVMKAAAAIKAQRVIDIANGKAEITDRYKGGKMLLSDLMAAYAQSRAENSRKQGHGISRSKAIDVVASHLEEYKTGARLRDIDKDFCEGFARYIDSAIVYGGKKISQGTAHGYFAIFNSALYYAVKKGLIPTNPVRVMDSELRPKKAKTQRDFLTIEEVRRLAATPMQDRTKQPFLFACFTGFRFGDVMGLTWDKIYTDGGTVKVRTKMQKTAEAVSLEIPNAEIVLPQRGNAREGDFVFPRWSNKGIDQSIKNWAESAGIKGKKVTFHTARHTYATMLLTTGADLYTVSKMLGHTEIRTTQIYAEIIDKKKEEAARRLEGVL